jgi:hypothetical protein
MEGITSPRVKTFWTGLRDQGAHMLYGLCLMLAFVFPVPAWGATILVMAVATERELEQHDWDITRVGRTDLFFWFLCCLIFNAVYYGIKYL